MIDAYTDTWRGVAAKCNEIIEAGRTRLEASEQSFGESQYIRGQIAAMRAILDLVKPAVVRQTASTPDYLRPRDRSGV
jgi:hypothetical protein